MKQKMDTKMINLVIFDTLKTELSGFYSPGMAIPTKNSDISRVVADFMYLKIRLP